ncbi:truncated FRIGIDA-like protein 1 [Cornus florida]|uniref:truncated FRIGIDA-like protein 1 n=1 Tax=Cornus florida TaxID=4283 RepID=UPI00289E2DC2|nr:truncated FRIGIDA-like protein 1 [Cornus florida]
MATMKTISAALKLIDAKKEKLRKAFEDLQSHSSSLSSFTLTWSDLDSHFTTLQSSLEHRFKLLQSQPQSHPSPQPQPPSSSAIVPKDSSDSGFALARPELKSFCEKMDGLGLRKYIADRPNERSVIRVELPDALRCAPDAPVMVLDAMEGFYKPVSEGAKNMKYGDSGGVKRSCLALLEGLMGLEPEIKAEVKARAMNLAVEWKKKARTNEKNVLEALGFLHLLATYGLVDGFKREELFDFAFAIATYKQAITLYGVLGFTDMIPDLIQKLIDKGKQLLAVKFIFEFKLTDKFSPVPILKEYVKEANNLAQIIRRGKNKSLQLMNEATMRETGALKSVIKVIEDHNLESEYPKESIVKRIEELEEEKAGRKRPAPMPQRQQSNQQKKSGGSKRPRTTASAGPAAIPNSVADGNSTVPTFQQPNLQAAGLLPDHPAPFFSAPAGPYGLAGSNLAVAPFSGSFDGQYGFSGSPFGFPGNLPPRGSHQYPSELYMPPGFDGPVAYGGYGLPPQHHPSYHPQ